MAAFTPRPRHLLIAGVSMGLALSVSVVIGCGARQRGAAVAKGQVTQARPGGPRG